MRTLPTLCTRLTQTYSFIIFVFNILRHHTANMRTSDAYNTRPSAHQSTIRSMFDMIVLNVFLTQENTTFKPFAVSSGNWKIQHMLMLAERVRSGNGSHMYRLVVDDISYKDFTQIYNEITPGLRPLIDELNAIAVMKTAHQLRLVQLETICVHRMLPLINHTNVCFMFAESYECRNILNKVCNDFIMHEFETLIDNNMLIMEMPDTVVQWVLSQHRLGRDNGLVEYKLFAAIVRWADMSHGQSTLFHESAHVDRVLDFIASRLKHVRLELINPHLIASERIKLVYWAARQREANNRVVWHRKPLNPLVKPFVYRREVS